MVKVYEHYNLSPIQEAFEIIIATQASQFIYFFNHLHHDASLHMSANDQRVVIMRSCHSYTDSTTICGNQYELYDNIGQASTC